MRLHASLSRANRSNLAVAACRTHPKCWACPLQCQMESVLRASVCALHNISKIGLLALGSMLVNSNINDPCAKLGSKREPSWQVSKLSASGNFGRTRADAPTPCDPNPPPSDPSDQRTDPWPSSVSMSAVCHECHGCHQCHWAIDSDSILVLIVFQLSLRIQANLGQATFLDRNRP